MSVIAITKYCVEYRYSYGWDNAHYKEDYSMSIFGTINDGQWLFDSVEEAQAEIDDYCSVPEPDKPYIKTDFRVVLFKP